MLSALHRTTEAGLSRLHECLVSIILLPVGSESMPKDMKALIQKDPQQLNFLDPLNLPELSHKQLYCDMDLTVVLLMSSKIRPWHSPSTPSRSSDVSAATVLLHREIPIQMWGVRPDFWLVRVMCELPEDAEVDPIDPH